MRWFTSDTHFAKTGDKILRREMRPYKTIKEYCDDQIRIWNEQASKDDVIYHLGDMCNYNGTEKDFLPGLMLVQEVNAKVILIMGNNEERVMQYCFENNFEKFRDFCIRHGFLDVKQNDTISIDGTKLYLVHRPIDCKPGMLNLYGHVHRQGGIFTDENGNKDVFMGCINGCSATLTQCEYTCGRYCTCDTVAVANDLLCDNELKS